MSPFHTVGGAGNVFISFSGTVGLCNDLVSLYDVFKTNVLAQDSLYGALHLWKTSSSLSDGPYITW